MSMTVKCILFISSLVLLSDAVEIKIDYANNTFTKDGKPYQYIAGSVHYFRIPEQYWEDRLIKVAAAGLTAITTYAPWNYHHIAYNRVDFTGPKNVFKFLELAQKYGLDVIFRGLPYSCGEYTFGGIPPWILTRDPAVKLRRNDPIFMDYVNQWFIAFLPKLKPYLAQNGGPIITVQVENEYGSWPACDQIYMKQLSALMRIHLGPETVLFTTDGDGDGYLKCGAVQNMDNGPYATVDFGAGFGPNVFSPQRAYEPRGPLVNSEYYVGWLDHWGQRHSRSAAETDVDYLVKLMKMGANVNMYMFHGGTNFGFTNGANSPPFLPQPTSYDYDAPLSEAGDITTKYVAIAKAVHQFRGLPLGKLPGNTTKRAYGKIGMQSLGPLTSLLPFLTKGGPLESDYPLSMEQLKHYEGLVLYRTTIPMALANGTLKATVRDRGYVSLNGVPLGIFSRMKPMNDVVNIAGIKAGDTLEILVENQGRINYGSGMEGDFKGIVSNVSLNGAILKDWTIYRLDFDLFVKRDRLLKMLPRESPSQLNKEREIAANPPFMSARLFFGEILADSQQEATDEFMPDTFIDPSSWGKGLLFLNHINLGRYWPSVGPQVTLYAPGPYFNKNSGGVVVNNLVVMVELERSSPDLTINSVDTPNLVGGLGTRTSPWRPNWSIEDYARIKYGHDENK